MTDAAAAVLAASTVRNGLMSRNARVWKVQVRTTLETCLSKDRVASSAPSNSSELLKQTIALAMSIPYPECHQHKPDALSGSEKYHFGLVGIQQQRILCKTRGNCVSTPAVL